MALETPPYVISALSHGAALFRLAAQTQLLGTGVVGAGSCQVTANGTPNMSVNVAAGMVWCPGTLGATTGMRPNIGAQTAYGLPSTFTAQGSYCAYNDASVNLTIAAADPSNPRIDLVCASIQDAQYAGSNNQPVLQVITGTPAPSPSAPAAPASSVVLAQVAVAASATSITSGNITDERPSVGGIARRRGPGSSFNLSGVGGTNNPITSWGSDIINQGNIAYSGGIYTVQDNSIYRWQISIEWPSTSASYAVWQYPMVNGTIDTGGSNRTQQATGQGATYYTCGDIVQPGPGGTVQAACQASTAGVTGVIGQSFSLYRVA